MPGKIVLIIVLLFTGTYLFASPGYLKIEMIGFNKVVIHSNLKGQLLRQVEGKITASFGLSPNEIKGRVIAASPRFPFVDTVPVSLSEVVWKYFITDRNGNLLAAAETNPEQYPKNLLPELILPGHPNWIVLYNKAWELNWHRMVTSKALPAHFAYNATPDNNMSYAWDACFNLLFQRYAAMSGADPTVSTLDNFYAEQAKSGYIDRYFNTQTFEAGWHTKKDSATVEGVNPPLFAWAEWNYFLITADKKRLETVLPKLIKHYDFIESFLQEKPGYYLWAGNPSGWDNIQEVQNHKYWVELPAIQALSARCIIKICNILGQKKNVDRFTHEVDKKRKEISRYWNAAKGWYCSQDEKGQFTGKTLSGMWPVLAGIVPDGNLKMITGNLMDTSKFLTSPMPLPVLAKDEKGYDPQGRYWHGSVWINISLLTIRSLEQHGYSKEAQELAVRTLNGMARVYNEWQPKPETLWECYAPEFVAPASHKIKPGLGSVRTDFADWTSCLINLLIENIMGIQVNAPVKTINWFLRMKEEHGIKNLRFGTVATDLVYKKSFLYINSNEAYTLKVFENGHIHFFKVKPGFNRFLLV